MPDLMKFIDDQLIECCQRHTISKQQTMLAILQSDFGTRKLSQIISYS
jgi:hypothetical protein